MGIAGRQSIMPPKMNTAEEEDEPDDNLIAMTSPANSPHKSRIRNNEELKLSNGESNGSFNNSPDINNYNSDTKPGASGDNERVTSNVLCPRLNNSKCVSYEKNLIDGSAKKSTLFVAKECQLAEMERVIESLEKELNDLKDSLNVANNSVEQLQLVLKEYEKTIAEVIDQKNKDQCHFETEIMRLQKENIQATQDLQNVEAAFADVHRKYERTKSVVEGFKQNEDT